MRAGMLKDRVVFQEKTSALDAEYGGQDVTWEDVATFRVRIVSLSGDELYAAQAINPKANVKVLARYRSGITAAMRMVHGDVVYDIHNVPPVPDSQRNMKLLCSTGLTQG